MQSSERPEKKFVVQKILHGRRQMLVILGIPFYISTGKNSKHSGTCLPHRGIGVPEKLDWIKKPADFEMPDELRIFCKKNDIDTIETSRLGNIRTACISASIGGGFWDTEKGKQLKNYLFEFHSQYFLDQDTVDLIKSAPDEKKESSVREANEALFEMGSIIPDHPDSRFPYEAELTFFEGLSNKDKLCQALMSMLTSQAAITKSTYNNIVKIVKDETLINYIIDQHLLEDSAQRDAFNQMMEKVELITLKDLEGINLFSKAELSLSQYDLIRVSPMFRKVLRERINSGKASKVLFDLYERLHNINCLNNKSFDMKEKNLEIFLALNQYGLLNPSAVKFIVKSGLLDYCYFSTTTKEGCFAVLSSYKIAKLNSEPLINIVGLYNQLNDRGLLSDESIKFLQIKGNFIFLHNLIQSQLDKTILDRIIKSCITLNEVNVELIKSLREYDIVKDCIDLLNDPHAVLSLKILRECKSLNEEHIFLLYKLKTRFLLEASYDLLENQVIRDILVRNRNMLSNNFINLVRDLNKRELLNHCADLFKNDLGSNALNLLFSYKSLTPENITVIDQLCKTGRLLEKTEDIRKMLLEAQSFPVKLETLMKDDVYKKTPHFWNREKKPGSEVKPTKPSFIQSLLQHIPQKTKTKR